MKTDDLRLFILAPEILVVDLADAALDSLLRALAAQHPALRASLADRDAPVQRAARELLGPVYRLRRALRRYRRAVHRLVQDLQRDDLPF